LTADKTIKATTVAYLAR